MNSRAYQSFVLQSEMEGKYTRIDINLILLLQECKGYSKRNTEQNKIEFYNGKHQKWGKNRENK
jgi:hypothetical protein